MQLGEDAMTGGRVQSFGGDWTERKLLDLRKYLGAYVKVLKNQPFQRLYIDAFAGTGYREQARAEPDIGFFARELAEDEPQGYLDGSARIALGVRPPFHRYLFIERSPKRFAELVRLKGEFASLADRMEFVQGDANSVLQALCGKWSSRMRGVLFLDPPGMQVDWTTLEAVARTQRIDVWILFPLGMGVNRLLPRNGKIPGPWRARLDRVFGTAGWLDAFYRPGQTHPLFGAETGMVKTGSFNAIAEYYQERLRTIFPAVADNPKVLRNSRNMPLFLLCFAVANPDRRAQEIALGIAQHILGRD